MWVLLYLKTFCMIIIGKILLEGSTDRYYSTSCEARKLFGWKEGHTEETEQWRNETEDGWIGRYAVMLR